LLTPAGDIHLDGSLSGIVHPDAEAALEALRAAIAQPSDDLHDDALGAVSSDEAHEAHEAHPADVEAEAEAEAEGESENEPSFPGAGAGSGVGVGAGVGLATHAQQLAMEKALSALTQLVGSNQTVLDNMNMPAVLAGLAGSFKLLVESQRRQAEMVKGLTAQLAGQATGASISPSPSQSPRCRLLVSTPLNSRSRPLITVAPLTLRSPRQRRPRLCSILRPPIRIRRPQSKVRSPGC
jgi:hypothetical protein